MRPYFVLRAVSVAGAWALSAACNPARASAEEPKPAAAATSASIATTRARGVKLLKTFEIIITSECHGSSRAGLGPSRGVRTIGVLMT